MSDATFNRRQFAQTLGLALGGALVLPELVVPAAEARQHAPRSADGAIQIDSNENPYGPSRQSARRHYEFRNHRLPLSRRNRKSA